MTKIVDMHRINEGDDTALNGTGVVKEDTIGKNINLSIQNDKLHLFDTNTDLRIN